jgi:hypothetical protein
LRKTRKSRQVNDSKKVSINKGKYNKPALSRRNAFKQMFGEILVSIDEVRGHKNCALSELETLEREKFEALIPFINKEFELSLAGNWLIGKNHNSGEKIRLFDLTSDKTTAFNLINGKNSIREIVKIFSEKMGWELEQSFEYVKRILLNLVNLKLCLFANPVDD